MFTKKHIVMPNSDKNNKSVKTLLDEYIKEQKWDDDKIKTFYKLFYLYYPYRRIGILKKELEKTVIHSSPGKTSSSNRIRRYNFARTLFLVFDIHYSTFGFDDDDLFPSDSSVFTSKSKFLKIENSQRIKNFEAKYTTFIEEYLNETDRKLFVHDYLGRGKINIPSNDLSHYFKAHKIIFGWIEAQLNTNPKMEYIRVLGLPIHLDKVIENTFESIATEILNQCSTQLFQHMCNCLKNENSHKRIKFYTRKPSRTYQFAILEGRNKTFIYNEHYELDKDGNANPSFVTIEEVQKNDDLLFIYGGEIGRHKSGNDHMYYTKERLVDRFKMSIKQYEGKFKSNDKSIRPIKDELLGMIKSKIKIIENTFGIYIDTILKKY